VIVFYEASALIYLIEGKAPFAAKVREELAALLAKHPDSVAALSRLTWLECRVGPRKNKEKANLAVFDAFFFGPIWSGLG
jgi:hypothetical protein